MSDHNPKRFEPLAIGGETTKFGTCTLCEAMCGIEITVQDGNVTSVRGDKLDPLSRGHICPKATALVDIHTDPDRLRRPVRRTEHGWQEMEWEEAIDLVARQLVEIRRAHGANAVGIYQGNPNVHSLGAMTHGKSFLALLNTRNRFSATSLDQLPHQLTNMLLYGHQLRQPITDIDHTQFFLVLGANPMASNGSMMTVPDFGKRVKELKARGGRLVVVDPRRTETAAVADTHIFIRPGTDSYLLLALMNTIIGENLARPADYVDGLDALADAVRSYTPDAVAALVGIDADTITELARDFASAECGAVYGRMGVSTQQFGSVCQWAVQVLNIITGNLDRVGGTMFTDPALDLIAQNIAGRGSFDRWRSRVRQLPEFSGEIPSSTLVDEMTTDGDGRIRSMIVAAGNPVLSTPGGERLDEAFAALDFMVSIDIYVNETSRHADVILPATTALEREHYDIVLSSFAVRNVAKFVPAAVPKTAGSRHDWEIYRDLGLRYLSLRRGEDRSALGKLRARTLGRLDSASLINEIKMRLSPAHSLDVLFLRARNGVSRKVLRSHPHGLDLGPLRPGLPGKLKTRDKRIQLLQPTITANLPSLAAATTPSDVELLLIGRRHLRSNNSWMHNSARLVKGKPRHHLLVHPDDLRVRGIDDGSVVRVSSVAGFVDVEVAASEQMMRGVVSLPHGFGHTKPGIRTRVASGVSGPNANDVTDPNQVDTVSANAVLNGIPVQITAPPEAHA